MTTRDVCLTMILPALLLTGCPAGGAPAKRPNSVDQHQVRVQFDVRPEAALMTRTGIDLTLSAGTCHELSIQLVCEDGSKGYRVCRRAPVKGEQVECDWNKLRLGTKVHVPLPWKGQVAIAHLIRPKLLRLKIDWSKAELNPLARETRALMARTWQGKSKDGALSVTWVPSKADVVALMDKLGESTVRSASGAVSLVVTSFAPVGGPMKAGRNVTLRMTVANRGPGIAYQVVAKTRSSFASLHGLRLSFGLMRPNQEKTREVTLRLELSPDRSAMVVTLLNEANHPPSRHAKRFSVVPRSEQGTRLSVTCRVQGKKRAGKPVVPQNTPLRLVCTVTNTGKEVARDVAVVLVGTAGTSTKRAPGLLPPRKSVTVHVSGRVSQTKLGADVAVTVTAKGTNVRFVGKTIARATIGAPELCRGGKLTRAQYAKKRKRLKAALDSGDLAQREFDHYDAELVSCLK